MFLSLFLEYILVFVSCFVDAKNFCVDAVQVRKRCSHGAAKRALAPTLHFRFLPLTAAIFAWENFCMAPMRYSVDSLTLTYTTNKKTTACSPGCQNVPGLSPSHNWL